MSGDRVDVCAEQRADGIWSVVAEHALTGMRVWREARYRFLIPVTAQHCAEILCTDPEVRIDYVPYRRPHMKRRGES